MAAQQPHRIVLERRRGRKTAVMAFQLGERVDQRPQVAGQFERGGIGVQFAGAG